MLLQHKDGILNNIKANLKMRVGLTQRGIFYVLNLNCLMNKDVLNIC